jgi:hypothetical protein
MKKSELLSKLQNNHECFFSLNQVIEMISGIEDEPVNPANPKISEEKLREWGNQIAESIRSEIYNVNESDVVPDDNIQFSVSYREIEIDSIEMDFQPIHDAVEEGIKDWIENLLEEMEQDELTESEPETTEG